MGVHGLWKLIEPSGKPVPLETLENKILAVDVSIWLHQAIKGFQDSKGAPLPNAHLLGIYHRVCKLLYFKVKPVFIFDGGVPALKKQTIAKRNQQKSKHNSDATRIQKQILNTLLKHTAITNVLSEKIKANLPVSPPKPLKNKDDLDIFKLPPSQLDTQSSSEDEEYSSVSACTDDTTSDSSPSKHWDLQSVDPKSAQFKALPADVRHEILTDLKETRKQNSWGRLHELPTQSDDFSGFQMKKLLKRYSVQVCLEEAEKEMGGHSLSLGELESLLNDHGVITDGELGDKIGYRIASDENTRYLYIKDVKKELEKARIESNKLQTIEESTELEKEEKIIDDEFQADLKEAIEISKNIELVKATEEHFDLEKKKSAVEEVKKTLYKDEFQRDLEKAIQLSLENEASTSSGQHTSTSLKTNSLLEHADPSVDEFIDADFSSDSSNDEIPIIKTKSSAFSAVKNYMLEYGGLTPVGVEDIFNGGNSKQTKNSKNVFKKSSKLPHANGKKMEDINVDGGKSTEEKIINMEASNIKSKVDASNKTRSMMESVDVSSSDNEFCDVRPKYDMPNAIVSENTHSTDSESSVEFLEVDENLVIEDNKINTQLVDKKFEIIIQPEDELEDDIFSDIFCENTRNNLDLNDITKKKPCDKEEEYLEEHAKFTTTEKKMNEEQQPEEIRGKNEKSDRIHFENIVTAKDKLIKNPKQIENDEDVESNIDASLDKEETRKVIQEMIKPVLDGPNNDYATLSTEQLKRIGDNLLQEKTQLISERSNKERLAGNITDQMYQEAQELLQLFGVPYIIAPMEAEAQCAFLDEINLTDGTITDDSDIWLFGGRTVYKNFFNQSKHVAEYKSENIQHHFKLSREQLILLALLVGSDYTTGIQGIGPVTALEILAAFPIRKDNDIHLSQQQLMSGLKEFRSWFHNGKVAGPGRATLRTKLKNIEFTDNFPSLRVIEAYLDPKVETNKEKFTWGKPNLVALTDYAKEKFGWTRLKSEEILKPVFKRLEETKSQTTIRDYFKTKHKSDSVDLQDKMSKRVKKAVNKMGKPDNDLSSDEDVKILKKTKRASKKKVKQIETEVKNKIEVKKKRPNLHTREFIPQKESDKSALMKNKLRAIEVFRKSVKGPGFVKKRPKAVRKAKDNAELSESSSD